jgi:hypothetical protein
MLAMIYLLPVWGGCELNARWAYRNSPRRRGAPPNAGTALRIEWQSKRS